MRKSITVIALLMASFFIFPSCEKIVGEGPIVTETRSTGNFTGISSEMSGKVNIRIANEFKVEVSAQRNILDVLQTHVVDGVLHIDFKDFVRVRTHEDLLINITVPTANYFRLSGSGDMHVHGDLATNSLQVKMSGSGNIFIEKAVVASGIDADISGSGNISILNGSAINQDLKISGSGKMEFAGVSSENAVTRISGSGDMKLVVSKKLDATISGSGSVYYHGNPIINTKISGSGKVIYY